jgi:uncharacterized membrane protein YdbT with pleckstrin-like domain
VGYVDRILQPGEEVIATGRLHWIVFLPGAAFLAAGGVLMIVSPTEEWLWWIARGAGALLLLSGISSIFGAWLEQWTTEIAVTPLRVIQKRGLIRRQTGEMNMQKIESVEVDQTILGRILNYGTVSVRGTGSGIEGLHHIADPLALRSAITAR